MRGFVTNEMINEARSMDLLTYLMNYEPCELVYIKSGIYSTKEHDSLKISNGKWMWWSRGIGGHNALDYLIKVRNIPLPQAVEMIIVNKKIAPPVKPKEKPKTNTKLILPKFTMYPNEVVEYLTNKRRIDPEIVKEFVDLGFIKESIPYHSAIFIGYDNSNKPSYAGWKSINNNRVMGECSGSKKLYPFRYVGNEKSNTVHLFECAVDLLSYATLLKMSGKNWQEYNLISVSGVYLSKKKIEDTKVPISALNYLDEHPNCNTIYVHFDNDKAGINATKSLQYKLSETYKVIDNRVPYGKDVNDFLLSKSPVINRDNRDDLER